MPIKRNPTCYCRAYHFPHRYGRGKCRRRTPLFRTAKRYRSMERRNRKAKRSR